MIGLSGRGGPAQGKAPDAGDAKHRRSRRAPACAPCLPACLPAGRSHANRQHDACAGRPDRPRITRDALADISTTPPRQPRKVCDRPHKCLRKSAIPKQVSQPPSIIGSENRSRTISALRTPHSAFRIPHSANAERNNPTRTGLSPDTHFSLAEIAEHAKNRPRHFRRRWRDERSPCRSRQRGRARRGPLRVLCVLCEKFVRFPLSACRWPLAALRFPLAACRLPQTLNAERNNPNTPTPALPPVPRWPGRRAPSGRLEWALAGLSCPTRSSCSRAIDPTLNPEPRTTTREL